MGLLQGNRNLILQVVVLSLVPPRRAGTIRPESGQGPECYKMTI